MSEATDDGDDEAFQTGRDAANGLAERLLLQSLIQFLADCAEDPDAFRARLREDALARLADVTGTNLSPAFMDGVREYATEAVRYLLTPPGPIRH